MARINPPNVIAVYDVGTHDGRVFVAMEFVRGTTLGPWVRDERRPWRAVLDAYAQAARGLAAAHATGLIHRDFKPDNAMIDDEMRVWVLDFGLARTGTDSETRTDETQADDSAIGDSGSGNLDDRQGAPLVAQRLTLTGSIMGTPAYMPPEQWCGDQVDARSDQYSWCVALWEALHGVRPIRGETLDGISSEGVTWRWLPRPQIIRTSPWPRISSAHSPRCVVGSARP